MLYFDRTLAIALIALGCVHNFVAAPLTFPQLTTRALWFVAAGLALWYAGFINLLRTRASARGDRLAIGLCALTNGSMLMFAIAYASVAQDGIDPTGILLVGIVAALTIMAVSQLMRVWRTSASSTA